LYVHAGDFAGTTVTTESCTLFFPLLYYAFLFEDVQGIKYNVTVSQADGLNKVFTGSLIRKGSN